jgi:SAM-dependent methyltransferase
MPRFDAAQVRRYYDRHTPAFVSFGEGGGVGAIHRAVWGPGVADRRQAFHYVEDQVAALVRHFPHTSARPHIVDLGCGVGASLCYLAERLPIRGTGITLSPVQAGLAARRIRKHGLADRVMCVEGDCCEPQAGIEAADLAYAIESFVHVPAPDRFFAQCRRLLRPGGVLAICDDVRRSARESDAARAIDQFCEGWRINTLLRQEDLRTLARAEGFEHESTLDLSPYLEIHRTRDRLISALVSLVGWLPAMDRTPLGPLMGGRALQTCLERGWIGYELAVFRRVE